MTEPIIPRRRVDNVDPTGPACPQRRQESYRPFWLRHFRSVSVLCGKCRLERLRPLFHPFGSSSLQIAPIVSREGAPHE
jgi:hypothetical protein